MNHLKKELYKRKVFLEKLIRKLDAQLLAIEQDQRLNSSIRDGTIRTSLVNNKYRYYLCTPEIIKTVKNGLYLKKNELYIARLLIQKMYCLKQKQRIIKQLEHLNKFMKVSDLSYLIQSYTNLSDGKKIMINPLILPDEFYIKRWLEKEHIGKPFADGSPEIYTDKGERVRSKSEKIIADLLFKHNIPYKYEKPLKLSSFFTIYPDFTILDVANRREIYLEHFGLMDVPEYVDKALSKITSYEKAGIFPGDTLIITHETKNHPLDTKLLTNILQHYDILPT